MTTKNHECYVSLEVAKLLKEAGFDWEVYTYYTHIIIEDLNMDETTGLMFGGKYNYNSSDDYSTPTLDVAQRWLREVKRISVEPGIDIHEKWKVLCCKYPVNNEWPDNWCLLDDTDETNPSYPTYEDAIEAGIKKALELILEKVK